MRSTPPPPAFCRTAEQREAWRHGYRQALKDVTTEQLSLDDSTDEDLEVINSKTVIKHPYSTKLCRRDLTGSGVNALCHLIAGHAGPCQPGMPG